MKKILLIIVVLVQFTGSYSQKSANEYLKDTINMPVAKGLREYYLFVGKAETEVQKGNFIGALDFFKKAFSYKLPFKEDLLLYKDIFANKKIVDSTYVIPFFVYYKKNSIDADSSYLADFVSNYPEFKKQTYWHILQRILDTVKTELKTSKIIEDRLNILLSKDQEIRNKCDSLYGFIWENTPCEKESREIDSANISELIKLIEENALNINLNPIFNSCIHPICLHAARRVYGRWIPLVLKLTRLGLIQKNLVADLLDQYQSSYYSKTNDTINNKSYVFAFSTSICVYDKYLILNLSDSEEKLVNKIRTSIFLEQYKITENRKGWESKQRLNNSNIYINVQIWNFYNYYVGMSEVDALQAKAILDDFMKTNKYTAIDLR
ncbi:MAG: hypothetical protein WCK02_15790 [Bacteroidota bacterium]